MPRIPFIGATYQSQSPNVDAERTVNWYPEIIEPGATGKNKIVLYPTPGRAVFCTLATSPVRALFYMDGRCFAVGGAVLYEIFSDGSSINRGAVATNANPATISSNGDGGNQLFITSGDEGYCYDLLTNTLTHELSGVTVGGFIDGYFLALDSATSTLKLSDLEDGTTWDPTMIAQRNLGPDRWIGMAVVHNEIWLLGTQTSEVWYNSGDAPFPLQPVPGAFLEQGMAAIFAYGKIAGSLIWLSANEQGQAMVMRSAGYQAQRVSTHAVEFALQGYTTIADAEAFPYQDQGHEFFMLNFPTQGATWGYDATTGLWHERGYWDSPNGTYDVDRPNNHAIAFGHHLVGDRTTGVIARQAINLMTESDGSVIRRVRRAPHLSNEQLWYVYRRIQLDLEVGMGTVLALDPQIMMRFSDDGAKTWSNERMASAGAQGTYKTRAIWRNLGRSRDRVFEIVVSDGTPWRLVDLYVEMQKGVA